MDYRKIIKEIGRGKNHARDLDRDTARGLYAHMLNGEVPDLELGGVLIALRIKGEGEAEMLGFYEAMQNHTIKLTPPAGKPMPIVIPSYNGARKQANLTPLLAILLHKLGFPVVVHGVSEDPTRVLTETIFELMGITPTLHGGQAQAKLDKYLLVKYMDGNVKSEHAGVLEYLDGKGGPAHFVDNGNGKQIPDKIQFPGYNEKWKRAVAADNGEVLKVID